MSRRLIIIEDESGEIEVPELEQVLERVRSLGLKAYAASSIFEWEGPSTGNHLPLALENLTTSFQGEQVAVETLLMQKTMLETELRKFRMLIENSGDLMYAIDFGGNVTFIGNNVLDFLGYTPEEVIGHNFLKLISVRAQKKTAQRFAEQMAGTAKGPFTTELAGKNGRVIPVEVNGRNYYEHNTAVLNIGLVRDISVREAMQTEVYKRNRELTTLYSLASVLSQSLDRYELLQECLDRMLETIGVETGGMLLLNPNGEVQLGAARGINEDFEALYRPVQNNLKLVRQVLVEGEVVIIENFSQFKALDPALIERTGYNSLVMGPLRAKDHILGSFILASKGTHHFSADDRELILSIGNQVGMALQIAELYAKLNNTVQELRQTNSQLEEATRHKSEFLATMSHELRTPLNAIIGFSELLLDQTFGPLNDKQNRYVDNIFNGGKHLLALVNDVLDLAKVEAGKMDLQLNILSAVDIVNEVVTTVAPLALKKQIALACAINGASGLKQVMVNADGNRFKQILYNLLSNAIKFTPEGGLVQIQRKIVHRHKKSWLELSISDNGIGIKTEDLNRIFEEFQMVDSTLARRQQGTGLGLALSRRLAHLHGGEIRVKSKIGSGSTFTLEIPLEPPLKEVTVQPVTINPVNPQAVGARQPDLALLIEEAGTPVQSYELYLEKAGYRVIRAKDRSMALETARLLLPTVVSLGMAASGNHDWEILRELKEDPVTRDIPVVVLALPDSGGGDITAFSMGSVACFAKPVRKAELSTRLAELQLAARHEHRLKYIKDDHQADPTLRALVLDSAPADIEIIRTALETAGMTVEVAASGEASLAAARKSPPDLVILDLGTVNSGGFEILRELRQQLLTTDIPVFIFTAGEPNSKPPDRLNDAESFLQKGKESGQPLLRTASHAEAGNRNRD